MIRKPYTSRQMEQAVISACSVTDSWIETGGMPEIDITSSLFLSQGIDPLTSEIVHVISLTLTS